MQLKPATRQGVKPLIALYSESGCGKTYSSLLLARGFVGPSGKIAMIDTESGRGSLYADVLPGGYDVLELDPPFSPTRYIEAMTAVENSSATIGIIDSGSHEWEGASGVLDMAAEIEARTGKAGLHCWKDPKLAHGLWIRALLRSKLPWIVCLRAKYKSRQTKNDQGKTVIVKDNQTSPIQAEDFIFEATAHAEILPDHSIILSKCSHPALRACFPVKGPITLETGAAIASWCAAGAASPALPGGTPAVPLRPQSPAPAAAPSKVKLSDAEKVAKWRTRCITAAGGDERYAIEMAADAGILLPNETLDDWPVDKLPKTKEQVDAMLNAISDKAGIPKNPEEIVP